MKERDIVDFTKMKKNEDGEFIDENGNALAKYKLLPGVFSFFIL